MMANNAGSIQIGGHCMSLTGDDRRRAAGRGREEGLLSAGLAVVAVSAAALLCASALVVMTQPAAVPSVLSFSFFSSSASAPSSSASSSFSSTFMLPASAAVKGYAKDLENMQQTLQADSLKPAGVVGDAPNLLAELGDG